MTEKRMSEPSDMCRSRVAGSNVFCNHPSNHLNLKNEGSRCGYMKIYSSYDELERWHAKESSVIVQFNHPIDQEEFERARNDFYSWYEWNVSELGKLFPELARKVSTKNISTSHVDDLDSEIKH